MKINVTANDIKRGAASDCYACPIALAATRAGLEGVRVDPTVIVGHGDDGMFSVPLPLIARQFVYDFDRGETCEPFSFTVET